MLIIQIFNILLIIMFCIMLPKYYLYIIFLILHECGHLLYTYLQGYRFNLVFQIPFGINIKLTNSFIFPRDNIIISIAGPMVNLVLFIVLRLFSIKYQSLMEASYINLILFGFNLLPAGFLDGGRLIRTILLSKLNFYWGELISNFLGLIMGVSLIPVLIFNKYLISKLTLLIFIIIMILYSFNASKKISFEIYNDILLKQKVLQADNKCTPYIIKYDKNTKILDIIKNFCFNKYYIIYIMDKGCLWNTINEPNLIKQFLAKGNIMLGSCVLNRED